MGSIRTYTNKQQKEMKIFYYKRKNFIFLTPRKTSTVSPNALLVVPRTKPFRVWTRRRLLSLSTVGRSL